MLATRARLVTLAPLAALLVACVNADDVKLGEMTIDLTDAPPPSAPAPAWRGELRTAALVQVSPDGVGWYNLGGRILPSRNASSVVGPWVDGPLLQVSTSLRIVELQSPTSSARVNQRDPIPADTYRHVRLWLYGTHLRMWGTFGDRTYAAESIHVATNPLMIQRVLEPGVRLDDGLGTTLEFDVNSEGWLTEAAILAKRIDTAQVKAATTLRIR